MPHVTRPLPRILHGTIADDVPCHRCGYNLRTLPANGDCPECGAPVLRSLRGDDLLLSDPAHLRRLYRGSRFVLACVALLVLTCILNGATQQPVMEYAGALTIGLGLYGAFLLTAPDPSGIGEPGLRRLRLAARILLLIGPTFVPLQGLAHVAGSHGRTILGDALGAGQFLTCAAGAVGLACLARYLRHLALRLMDQSLASSFEHVGITLAVSIALLALENLFLREPPSGPKPFVAVVTCAAVIPFFALIGSSFILVWNIIKFGAVLRANLPTAEQLWSRPPRTTPPPPRSRRS